MGQRLLTRLLGPSASRRNLASPALVRDIIGKALAMIKAEWAAAGFMDTLLRCEDETGGG